MVNHTNGPWSCTKLGAVIGADGHEVACVWKGDSANDKNRDDANAALITAAPRMFSAIEAFLREEGERDNPSAWEAAFSELRNAYESAKPE